MMPLGMSPLCTLCAIPSDAIKLAFVYLVENRHDSPLLRVKSI